MNTRQYSGEPLEYFTRNGYRQVSRRYKIVSKVDVSIEKMQKFFIKQNYNRIDSGIPKLPLNQQMDHYRRVYSKDNIEGVPEEILRFLR